MRQDLETRLQGRVRARVRGSPRMALLSSIQSLLSSSWAGGGGRTEDHRQPGRSKGHQARGRGRASRKSSRPGALEPAFPQPQGPSLEGLGIRGLRTLHTGRVGQGLGLALLSLGGWSPPGGLPGGKGAERAGAGQGRQQPTAGRGLTGQWREGWPGARRVHGSMCLLDSREVL